MIKKISQVVLLFFIAFSFQFCMDEELQNPQPDDDASRRRLKPRANAGSDIVITLPTNLTKLDGSKSKDSLGVIKSYSWKKVAGPASSTLTSPTSSITDAKDLTEGAYTFRLTVINDRNVSAYDDVVVTVNKSLTTATALPTSISTEDLYFSGNMDNVSISNNKLLGWSGLTDHPYITDAYFNNLGGTTYAFQEIRKDPVNTITNVLYAQTIDDDPNGGGTSRAQMSIGFTDGVNLPVYHTSHSMYLHPDIAYLTNYSSAITWFTLYEIWNKRNDAWSGDPAGSARWNLALYKASGAGQPLYWMVEAELMQPSTQNWMWKSANKTVPVPIGKWFTLDVYMKRGEGTNGRFTIKITVDGVTSTICDVANTTIYPGHPEIQLSALQPFKMYTNDAILDWMRANNKKFAANYNNFKWYKN